MAPDKHVLSCQMRLGKDDVWVAVLSTPNKRHLRDDTCLIGRSSTWDGAIARAMNRRRLDIATASDEHEILVAAHRQRSMKLLKKGGEIHFLGLE